MKVHHNNFEIELKDDNFYTLKSSGNLGKYKYEYNDGKIVKNRIFAINKRGIIVRDAQSKTEISSAILCENGGRTTMSQALFQLDADQLWICVGDKMYCLAIPTLEVNWFSRLDYGVIHAIRSFRDDFIVHGNLGIMRIDKGGNIQWKFMGGNGVFIAGEGRLKVHENHIELIDGNGAKYLINEFGEKFD